MGSTNDSDNLPDITDRSLPSGISVIVVGSGIGGLTAARECWRLGCDVRVYERQPHPVLTGDSFTIGYSALISLKHYPRLQKEVDDMAVHPLVMLRKIDGSIVKGPFPIEDFIATSVDRELASKFLRLSRPKVYNAMLKHLDRLGIPVEHGRDVVDYFEDASAGRAGVILRDGSRHEADVVIAADGVGGHSWKLTLGQEVPAKPSGDAMFRASYPTKSAIQDPVVDKLLGVRPEGRPEIQLYWGPNIQFYLSRFEDVTEWVLAHEDDGRARESWDHHPSLESVLELLNQYKDCADETKRIVATAPPGVVVDWRIMWRDPQPQWTSPAGRVVQIGDAAHTFHPSSGNGGTQAMEDAVSIAKCLSVAGKDNIMWATRVHNLLRFERVSCLQAFGIASQEDRKKEKGLPSFGSWIVLHDPGEYAAKQYADALSHLQNGTPFKNTNTPKDWVYVPWTIEGLVAARDRGEKTIFNGDWS